MGGWGRPRGWPHEGGGEWSGGRPAATCGRRSPPRVVRTGPCPQCTYIWCRRRHVETGERRRCHRKQPVRLPLFCFACAADRRGASGGRPPRPPTGVACGAPAGRPPVAARHDPPAAVAKTPTTGGAGDGATPARPPAAAGPPLRAAAPPAAVAHAGGRAPDRGRPPPHHPDRTRQRPLPRRRGQRGRGGRTGTPPSAPPRRGGGVGGADPPPVAGEGCRGRLSRPDCRRQAGGESPSTQFRPVPATAAAPPWAQRRRTGRPHDGDRRRRPAAGPAPPFSSSEKPAGWTGGNPVQGFVAAQGLNKRFLVTIPSRCTVPVASGNAGQITRRY